MTSSPRFYVETIVDVSFQDLVFHFADAHWAVLLETQGVDTGQESVYSIFAMNPFETLSLYRRDLDSAETVSACLAALESRLQDFSAEGPEALPFWGGAIGYVGYEFAVAQADFSHIDFAVDPAIDDALPVLRFGFYNMVFVYAHRDRTLRYITFSRPDQNIDRAPSFRDLWRCHQRTRLNRVYQLGAATVSWSKQAYLRAFSDLKAQIREGAIYQANLTQRFSAPFFGDAFDLYRQLLRQSPAPYSAYLSYGDGAIASVSPELFLRMDGRDIATRPIKGTRPRGESAEADRRQHEALRLSEKDRAELTMIVDLSRHDLGRCCRYGSIQTSALPRIRTFAQLFHLDAEVTGQLREDVSHLQALMTCFPGGSITGAPKIRAVALLADLEPVPRHVYTGCIGYLGFGGQSQFNIAIRTAYIVDGQVYYHAGGGIVADSTPEEEWQELHTKARFFSPEN